MEKYFANMNVNNNLYLKKDIENNNLKKLKKLISAIARNNCYIGNEYSWKIWNKDGIIKAAGSGIKTKKGYKYLRCQDMIGETIY